MKYGEITFGQVEAIINKLGGMDGVRRFLAGETIVASVSRQAFKVWRTINLGTVKSPGSFHQALKNKGCRASNWASDVLSKPVFTTWATKKTEIDLVVVSGRELGFKEPTKRDQIYARARERGLMLCPAEVGPQLRLQYPDQQIREWLYIAMEPIARQDGSLMVFDVRRDGSGLWLFGSCGSPGDLWNPEGRWVFCFPRK